MVESRLAATSRQGTEVAAEAVTVIRLRQGRVVHVQDCIFDTGETVRVAWDEARAARAGGV